MPDSELAAKFTALRREYAGRLPGRTTEMADMLDRLAGRWDRGSLEELHRLAHNLAGSGASYGFPDVSTSARRLELALARLLEVPTGAQPDLTAVRAELAALCEACRIVGATR